MSPPPTSRLDRSTPPEPAAQRPFSMPGFDRLVLAGGLEVRLSVQRRLPLVHLELLIPAGAACDPPERRGLATMAASLMDEGTAHRTSMEIAAAAERLGGWVGSGADWDATEVSTGLQARHLQAGLELVAEIATAPTFPTEELERLRALRLAEHRRRAAQPAVLAANELARTLYGDGVYGTPTIGTEATTRALTREDVMDFHRHRHLPAGSTLLAVGDIDPDSFGPAVDEALGTWTSSQAPSPAPQASPASLEEVTVRIVDRPEAAQTELRLGQPGVPRRHPDFPVLQVMNSLLGGKFTSRINLNLRERHGYTYGAYSRFATRRGPGPFVVSAAVANDVAGRAAWEVLSELHRIRDEEVGDAELTETRSYLEGVFPYTLQGLDGFAARLRSLAIHQLPDDHFATFLDRIRSTTAAEVREAARRHLDPERVAVVAAGPAKELVPQLEPLGPVEIVAQPGEEA